MPPPGYRDVSMSLERIVKMAQLPGIALLVGPIALYLVIYGFRAFFETVFTLQFLILAIPVFVVMIVIHEGLHALGWMLAGRLPMHDVKFGFDRATFSPYAHARAELPAWAYRFGAALPGILTGLLPALLGLWWGHGALIVLGAAMLSSAIGDIIILYIIREVPNDAIVRDHPSRGGCYVKEA